MADDRGKALEAAVTQIKKQYGDGAVMRLGEAQHLRVASIPTGSLALDLALGVGGIPRGRVTEIYGPEASGKTTLAQHIVAEAQRAGGVCAYIDMEHALDPEYAERTGVNIDELYISQPDTGEQALEITETLVRTGAVDVVVIDSVAALVPRAEIEGDMGDPVMGMQARLMSQALRKLSGVIKQANTAVVFTNQLRQRIGVMFHGAEVLRFDTHGHAAHREHQDWARGGGESHTRASCEEQSSAAVQGGRVRHHVQRGDLQGGGHPRHGCGVRIDQQEGLILFVWRREAGPGAGEFETVLARASRAGEPVGCQDTR